MRKLFSFLAFVICGIWGASSAQASTSYCDSVSGNLVLNCGFESGDFTSWTLSGNTDPTNSGNYYGVDNYDAQSGNYGAYLSQYSQPPTGTAPLDLSQTIATTSGLMYTVSFYLEQDDAPTANETHTFSAMFGSSTLLNLTPSIEYPGQSGLPFTQYTYSVAATSSSTLLNFVIRNDDDYWSLDDVVVAAQVVTPEPSTLVLGATALAGLLLMRRRIAG